jgi:hypothetical protein
MRKYGNALERYAALICCVVVANACSRQLPPEASTDGEYTVAVSSLTPLPETVAASEVRAASSEFPAESGTVTPLSDTPNGFKLWNPGFRRSDYVYDSHTVYQTVWHCSSGQCQRKAQVSVQLRQRALGARSHTWELRLRMREVSNSAGLTWSYFATYWCGVNVSGGNDYICRDGAAPSGERMSINSSLYKPWGRTNGITVFPMVQATTQFSNGLRATTKFRGWDTLSRSRTTKLKATSGDGS